MSDAAAPSSTLDLIYAYASTDGLGINLNEPHLHPLSGWPEVVPSL